MIQGYYVEVCDMILSLGYMLVNSHLKHLKIKVRSKKDARRGFRDRDGIRNVLS